jgi:hypothetical protein
MLSLCHVCHETINGRLKHFRVLSTKFCHSLFYSDSEELDSDTENKNEDDSETDLLINISEADSKLEEE